MTQHIHDKRCDAEIKTASSVRQWRACGRKARVQSTRELAGSQYSLYFCTRHADRAPRTDSPRLIRVIDVRSLQE